MNSRDREVVDRLDRVLREVAALRPWNPGDSKAVFDRFPIAVDASDRLVLAIAAVRAGDYDAARSYCDEADRVIARRRAPSAEE